MQASRWWRLEQAGRFLVLGFFVSIFLASSLVQAWRDSPGVDESVDMAAGLVAVEHRDLRLNPEHGILGRSVSALLPVLVADPIVPRGAAFESGDWFDYTDDLISANEEAGRLRRVLFWFRIGGIVAGALAGGALYALGSRLHGSVAGLVAAGLWLTTPYVIGLSHLSSLDVWFAASVAAVCLGILRLVERPDTRRAIEIGALLGGTLLVRHHALILVVPVIVSVLWTSRHDPGAVAARRLVVAGVASLATVWLAYRVVDPSPVTGQPRERFDGIVAAAHGQGLPARLALAVPLPIEWRAGLGYLFLTSEGRPGYLLGSYWVGGRPWFLPLSAFLKMPVTTSIAAIVGFVGLARSRPARSKRRPEFVLGLGIPALVLVLFELAKPLNLGLRLGMPLVALVFVAVGVGLASIASKASRATTPHRRRLVPAIGSVVVVGSLAAAAAAHPNSLAWSPPPFGDGYRSVSDGSIDVGQANNQVRVRHDRQPLVAASLFAPRGFDVLPNVPAIGDVQADALVGDVAVSAAVLTVYGRDELSWLRAYCPVHVIGGGAVLVYRFTSAPDTSPGPGMPAPPCRAASASSRG